MQSRHHGDGAFRRGLRHNHRKLIPAKPTDRIAWPYRPLELTRNSNDRLVAHVVPPGVVDVFKVVDINQQYRGGAVVAPTMLKFISQQHFPVPTVKDPGHPVAGAHHFQPLLMFRKPDGGSVAEPGKQHGIQHEHG